MWSERPFSIDPADSVKPARKLPGTEASVPLAAEVVDKREEDERKGSGLESEKSESGNDESSRTESVKNQSDKTESDTSESGQNASDRIKSDSSESGKTEPGKTATGNAVSADIAPAGIAPASSASARAESDKNREIRNDIDFTPIDYGEFQLPLTRIAGGVNITADGTALSDNLSESDSTAGATSPADSARETASPADSARGFASPADDARASSQAATTSIDAAAADASPAAGSPDPASPAAGSPDPASPAAGSPTAGSPDPGSPAATSPVDPERAAGSPAATSPVDPERAAASPAATSPVDPEPAAASQAVCRDVGGPTGFARDGSLLDALTPSVEIVDFSASAPTYGSSQIYASSVTPLPDLGYGGLERRGLVDAEVVEPHLDKNGFSDNVRKSRENLTELMEQHLDAPQRQRFQVILDRFELRGRERVEAQVAAGQDQNQCMAEWDQKICRSYDSLATMLNPNQPNATYDLNVRAKLVEAAAFSLACPVKANDQGNWGCCWMISGVFAGVIQYPDRMSDMLAQLSNTGSYTDIEGRSWTPPKGLLSITSQGGRWTIENCGGGHRSPVSEIWTSVAAYLSEDGRRTDRGASGGTENACNHAMKKITGDTWTVTSERAMVDKRMQKELLEKGAYICVYPGHMYLAALEKHGNDWLLCASLQHGDGGRRVNGTVSDLQSWTITGGRRGYNPDINLPECQDSPTGPIGNDWPGGGGYDWPDFPFPIGPDPWPLLGAGSLTDFVLSLHEERDRRLAKERAEDEEEEKKKRAEQKQKEEIEIAEEKAEEELRLEKKRMAELEAEQKAAREMQEAELARGDQEGLVRQERQGKLRQEAEINRLLAMENQQSPDKAGEFMHKSQLAQSQINTSRPLSTQIVDRQSFNLPSLASALSDFRSHRIPVASELTNRLERIAPASDLKIKTDKTKYTGSPPESAL
ncbi:MAG: hypothetical protein AB7W16_15900 [Candidatus Obscuribacterales bacterium]